MRSEYERIREITNTVIVEKDVKGITYQLLVAGDSIVSVRRKDDADISELSASFHHHILEDVLQAFAVLSLPYGVAEVCTSNYAVPLNESGSALLSIAAGPSLSFSFILKKQFH